MRKSIKTTIPIATWTSLCLSLLGILGASVTLLAAPDDPHAWRTGAPFRPNSCKLFATLPRSSATSTPPQPLVTNPCLVALAVRIKERWGCTTSTSLCMATAS